MRRINRELEVEGMVGNAYSAVLILRPTNALRQGFSAFIFNAYAADFRQLFCRLDDMSFRVEGVFLLGDEFYDVSAISADEAIKELHIEIDVQRGPRVAMERAEGLPL